jgi:amidase
MTRAEFLKTCLAAGVSARALWAGTLPNFEELTITGLHRLYRNREVSVSDVVECYLTRVEKLDKFRAIAWINPRAREEARVQDEQLRKHGPRGTLFGVPVFAKANYDIAGVPTTAANTTLSKTIPQPAPRDAAQVQRLKAAGAIILGKTNCDDFAFGGEGASTL